MEWLLGTVVVVALSWAVQALVGKRLERRIRNRQNRDGSIPASFRGDPPEPAKWNFNGGHLIITADELRWYRHLRPGKVWTLKRSDLKVQGLRDPERKEIWNLSFETRILQAQYQGHLVELALLPNDMDTLMAELGYTDGA